MKVKMRRGRIGGFRKIIRSVGSGIRNYSGYRWSVLDIGDQSVASGFARSYKEARLATSGAMRILCDEAHDHR